MARTSMTFIDGTESIEIRCFNTAEEMYLFYRSERAQFQAKYTLSIKEATDLKNFIDEQLKSIECS